MKSKLPWTTSRHPDPDCAVRYVNDAEGNEVCATYQDLGSNISNVNFITQACNTHEVLVAALKRAHLCATIDPQGRCDGCFISDVLASIEDGKD